jgi:hypothetical protein
MTDIIWCSPLDLRPHPLYHELYGPPTAHSAYADIRADMKCRGFDASKPLLITEDARIICGIVRHAAAKSLKLNTVPCRVFTPQEPATAELEIERELLAGNIYRITTETMKAREQRKMLTIEKAIGRVRKTIGLHSGPGKAADRVGKVFGESGGTVQRRLKVLDAIEKAEASGNTKLAARLTELLNTRQITKALALLKPAQDRTAPIKKVDR